MSKLSCIEFIAADEHLGNVLEVELHVVLDESWFGSGVHVDSECLDRRGWNLKIVSYSSFVWQLLHPPNFLVGFLLLHSLVCLVSLSVVLVYVLTGRVLRGWGACLRAVLRRALLKLSFADFVGYNRLGRPCPACAC